MNGEVHIIDLTSRKLIEIFNQAKEEAEGAPILSLCVSDDGQWLAVGDLLNRITDLHQLSLTDTRHSHFLLSILY